MRKILEVLRQSSVFKDSFWMAQIREWEYVFIKTSSVCAHSSNYFIECMASGEQYSCDPEQRYKHSPTSKECISVGNLISLKWIVSVTLCSVVDNKWSSTVSSAKCDPVTSSRNPLSSEQGPLSPGGILMLAPCTSFLFPSTHHSGHFDVVTRSRGAQI
jgi:hypothetical protein